MIGVIHWWASLTDSSSEKKRFRFELGKKKKTQDSPNQAQMTQVGISKLAAMLLSVGRCCD